MSSARGKTGTARAGNVRGMTSPDSRTNSRFTSGGSCPARRSSRSISNRAGTEFQVSTPPARISSIHALGSLTSDSVGRTRVPALEKAPKMS